MWFLDEEKVEKDKSRTRKGLKNIDLDVIEKVNKSTYIKKKINK